MGLEGKPSRSREGTKPTQGEARQNKLEDFDSAIERTEADLQREMEKLYKNERLIELLKGDIDRFVRSKEAFLKAAKRLDALGNSFLGGAFANTKFLTGVGFASHQYSDIQGNEVSKPKPSDFARLVGVTGKWRSVFDGKKK